MANTPSRTPESTSRHPKPPRRTPKPERPKLPTAALEAREVAKEYGDSVALFPLDLRVEPHQRVALIGHNGSGKTTLLRLAAGLLEPSEGSVTVFDHAAGSLEARRSLSYLADNPTFYEDLSVWEHLEYVARMHGRTDWEQHAADLLGGLGLYERADDLPNSFSRGLRQKAAIALAFVRPFELLLVDEPFVGLDATGKQALIELFDDAAHDGATLLIATHELSFIEHCDRLVALRDGALVFDGAPSGADLDALVRRIDGSALDERDGVAVAQAGDAESDAVGGIVAGGDHAGTEND